MTNETDRSPAGQETPSASVASPSAASIQRTPRFALFIATAAGLGYLPKAPGTFGSLGGIVLAILPWWAFFLFGIVSRDQTLESMSILGGKEFDPFLGAQVWLALTVAVVGVWSAGRAANFQHQKDPQQVVIDEVSGQHLALLLGLAIPIWWKPSAELFPGFELGAITVNTALNWKYLLLGFILFRVFDIWKPFPARQAESLPGGWGIMADDWIAGIYAGLGLWIARAMGF
ncbi:MAG: phosphatidylglycerophosphatase A [Candidatus Acidiferrales bacterium]